MGLRLSVYELTAQHGLSPEQARDLWRLAALDEEPPGTALWLTRLIAVLAAALLGLGLILWLAANWSDLGRMTKFALLEGIVVAAASAAALRREWRTPFLLLALFGQGAVLAFFGQTYQTGADPWQLFALWAVLALPLALAARSDVLWVPFALVAVTAVALWTYAHTGRSWSMSPDGASIYFVGWLMALAVAVCLSPWPALRGITGAGVWSFRTSVTLALVVITLTGLSALFSNDIRAHYLLSLVTLTAAGGLLVRSGLPDIFTLSALGLALDSLLFCGLARLLFEDAHAAWSGQLFILGVFAAGLVAGTASLVRRLTRPAGARRAGEL